MFHGDPGGEAFCPASGALNNNSLEALATNIDHEAGSLETKSLQALKSNIDHETHAPLKLRASRLPD